MMVDRSGAWSDRKDGSADCLRAACEELESSKREECAERGLDRSAGLRVEAHHDRRGERDGVHTVDDHGQNGGADDERYWDPEGRAGLKAE